MRASLLLVVVLVAALGQLAAVTPASAHEAAALGARAEASPRGVMGAFAPVPDEARGPTILTTGHPVEEIRDGLYWVTGGLYQAMFLTTGEGVILVDVPPPLSPNLAKAIADVTDEPIKYVVYSHHHADHICAAGEET